MKHPKKRFVSALLAVAMVITCFLSFGGVSAAATTSTEYFGPVYYFYDYYPSLKEFDLYQIVTPSSMTLDGQYVTEDEFYDLIDEGHFEDIEFGSFVFIDIKTFEPAPSTLITLFQYLRSRDCYIVLISTYTDEEAADYSLDDYVDVYFHTNFEQLEQFIRLSVYDLISSFDEDITGTCFLIDSNMIDTTTPRHTLSYLCEVSPFLRLLLLELDAQLEMYLAVEPINNQDYQDILECLSDDYNITLYVHEGNNIYHKIGNWNAVHPSSVADLQTSLAPSGTQVCAFGFWELASSFYNFLYAGQQSLGYQNLPVYVFEINSVGNSVSGLVVNSDDDMAWYYGDMYEDLYGELSDERDRFMAALLEWMEEWL